MLWGSPHKNKLTSDGGIQIQQQVVIACWVLFTLVLLLVFLGQGLLPGDGYRSLKALLLLRPVRGTCRETRGERKQSRLDEYRGYTSCLNTFIHIQVNVHAHTTCVYLVIGCVCVYGCTVMEKLKYSSGKKPKHPQKPVPHNNKYTAHNQKTQPDRNTTQQQ